MLVKVNSGYIYMTEVQVLLIYHYSSKRKIVSFELGKDEGLARIEVENEGVV